MVWILTMAIIAVLSVGLAWAEEEGFPIFLGVLAAIVFTLPFLFIPGKSYQYTESELITLNDGSSDSGEFFLGSGYVDGNMVYRYYQKDGAAAVLKQVSAENVKVYEGGQKAYAETQSDCTPRKFWSPFCTIDDSVVNLYVPSNTIKNDFLLDAQ